MRNQVTRRVTTTMVFNDGNPGLLTLLKFDVKIHFPDGTRMVLDKECEGDPKILCIYDRPKDPERSPGVTKEEVIGRFAADKEGLASANEAMNTYRERHQIFKEVSEEPRAGEDESTPSTVPPPGAPHAGNGEPDPPADGEN